MELEESRSGRVGRRQRFSVEQKRQMVEATLVPGASVARVAREHGVNANQVFAWRGLYKQGLLVDRDVSGVRLLPIHIATVDEVDACATAPTQRTAGSINLEFPGKALMTIEGSPDRESLRLVLERLLR
jgi:transposase